MNKGQLVNTTKLSQVYLSTDSGLSGKLFKNIIHSYYSLIPMENKRLQCPKLHIHISFIYIDQCLLKYAHVKSATIAE